MCGKSNWWLIPFASGSPVHKTTFLSPCTDRRALSELSATSRHGRGSPQVARAEFIALMTSGRELMLCSVSSSERLSLKLGHDGPTFQTTFEKWPLLTDQFRSPPKRVIWGESVHARPSEMRRSLPLRLLAGEALMVCGDMLQEALRRSDGVDSKVRLSKTFRSHETCPCKLM